MINKFLRPEGRDSFILAQDSHQLRLESRSFYARNKKNFFTLILFLVIIFSFLLRLWKSQELFFWHVDEDIVALTIKRILVDHRPQLVGFPIPGGIYLGPLVFYLLAIPYTLSRMDPSILPYFSAILSTFTVFLVYFIGKTIFENRNIGLIAAVIYGFSFLTNVYSRIYSGLSLVGILSLLTYLFLFNLIKNKKGHNFFYLSLVLLIAVQNEGSSFSILLLSVLLWFVYRFRVDRKQLIVGMLILLVSHIPLFIFNLRHNFLTVTTLINFLSKASVAGFGHQNTAYTLIDVLNVFPQSLSRFFYVSGPNNIATQILPCPDLIAARATQNFFIYTAALFIICIFLVKYLFKKNRPLGESIIFFHFLVLICGLLIYNLFMIGYSYEWTLLVFFPGFSLIVASIAYEIYKRGFLQKTLILFLLSLFILLNIKLTLTSQNSFGLKAKSLAVKDSIKEIGDKSFALDSIGSCFAQGYVYLFWYFGKEQVSSYADEWFGSGIIKPQSDARANLKVVMVNPSKKESEDFFKKYLLYKAKAFKSKEIGEVEVLFLKQEEI